MDRVALVCESEAALSDRVIEALDGGEAAVGERFVDEPPKIFGRLGTVGGLEYETNAVGHGEVLGSGTTYVLQNQEATRAQTTSTTAGRWQPQRCRPRSFRACCWRGAQRQERRVVFIRGECG
jgi:hypothetical protein